MEEIERSKRCIKIFVNAGWQIVWAVHLYEQSLSVYVLQWESTTYQSGAGGSSWWSLSFTPGKKNFHTIHVQEVLYNLYSILTILVWIRLLEHSTGQFFWHTFLCFLSDEFEQFLLWLKNFNRFNILDFSALSLFD